MSDYIKALISTVFLFETLGLVVLGMIWAVLGLLHASNTVLISGEVVGVLVLLTASVPIYRMILRAERENSRQLVTIETGHDA